MENLLEGYKKLNFLKRLFFPWKLQWALLELAACEANSHEKSLKCIAAYKAFVKSNFIVKWLYSCLFAFGKSEDKLRLDTLNGAGQLDCANAANNFNQLFSIQPLNSSQILLPQTLNSSIDDDFDSDDESFYSAQSEWDDDIIESHLEEVPLNLDKDEIEKAPSHSDALPLPQINLNAPLKEIRYAWFQEDAKSYDSKAYSIKFKRELEACEETLEKSTLSKDAIHILDVLKRYANYMIESGEAYWNISKLLKIKAAGDALTAGFNPHKNNRDCIPTVTDKASCEIAMTFARNLLRYDKVVLTAQEVKDLNTHKKKTPEQQLQRTLERGLRLKKNIEDCLQQVATTEEMPKASSSAAAMFSQSTASNHILENELELGHTPTY